MDGEKITGDKYNAIIDEDSLTYVAAEDLKIVCRFLEPKVVKSFAIQPRNDDNNIRIGDEYDLIYWDNKWVSMGRKIAEADSLIYPMFFQYSILAS